MPEHGPIAGRLRSACEAQGGATMAGRIQAVVATRIFGSMPAIGQALRLESSNLGFFAVSR